LAPQDGGAAKLPPPGRMKRRIRIKCSGLSQQRVDILV
jgi:hypothetical protein